MIVPILQYRDFWDVARMFFVRHRNQLVLFNCAFDDETEDFADEYRVTTMPELEESDLSGSWVKLPERSLRLLGVVPVARVIFDSTKRQSIDAALLDELMLAAPQGSMASVPIRG